MRVAKVIFTLVALTLTMACNNFDTGGGVSDVTVTAVISADQLVDINTGIAQDVSTGWIKMGTALYFINNPSSNPGHQIWKSTAAGSASLVVDLGLENNVTTLLADTRSTASPTRFYFVVNGTQLWTSNGTTTTKIAEYQDSNGIISTSVIGNDIYYQVNGSGSNGPVYKSVAGATPGEIYTTGTTSFAAAVTFLRGTTKMYIYLTAANSTVYSHSGAAGAATTVRALTAANTVTQAKVATNDLYFQESASFKIYKSVNGAAAAEVKTDAGASFGAAATTVAGTNLMYIYMNAANDDVFSHSGSAANCNLIDTTPAANVVTMPRVVGDDLYYQYDTDFDVVKSVSGTAIAAVKDSTGTDFAAAVTMVSALTLVYIYHTAANSTVYAHSGTAANAGLVVALTAANTVTSPTVVSDDLYFQESASFKVFKSSAGAAGGEVTDNAGTSFAAAVSFVAGGTSKMYMHGNVSGGNATVYSHSGNAGATQLVLNGAVGTFNSAKMITVGDNLFFQGATTSPRGLFDSVNGAAAIIVGNFDPSADDDYLCTTSYTPAAISTRLFFVANNGSKGCELWTTNGTSASIVADVASGQRSANPTKLTVVGTRIYFVAQDYSVAAGPSNTYLYYSDSPYTSASKVTLTGADANPSPRYLTAVGTKLYFGALVAGVVTLYEHDATGSAAAGIKQESTPLNLIMNAGTEPFIVAVGTKAYIRAAPLGTAVYDVYVSDSTIAITENPAMVKHINASVAASSNPTFFKDAHSGSTLFFTADDGTGVELWKTTGTSGTTVRIRNTNGSGTGSAAANPSNLKLVGSNLYFTATDNTPGDGGAELYVAASPWTSATKLTFRSTDPQIANLNALGDYLIFTMSEDGTAANSGIYRTDGTVTGTIRLRAPAGTAAPTFNALGAGSVNDFLFYAFQPNSLVGNQLFATDGTLEGTGLVKALNPSPFDAPVDELATADVANFAVLGDYLIFPGNNGTSGKQLWYTDGTAKNTAQISNFTPLDNNGSAPALLGVAGDAVYYVLRDVTHGRTIYKISQ